MSDVKLKVWTSPKTGQVRVYADTRWVWHAEAIKDAHGCYFYAGEEGETKVWFPPNPSGRIGFAAYQLQDYLRAMDLPFSVFLARIEAAKTKGGNFSAIRYFKELRPHDDRTHQPTLCHGV